MLLEPRAEKTGSHGADDIGTGMTDAYRNLSNRRIGLGSLGAWELGGLGAWRSRVSLLCPLEKQHHRCVWGGAGRESVKESQEDIAKGFSWQRRNKLYRASSAPAGEMDAELVSIVNSKINHTKPSSLFSIKSYAMTLWALGMMIYRRPQMVPSWNAQNPMSLSSKSKQRKAKWGRLS